ncbi:RHS repeat domain-containing protein [Ensifer adhaerens]|uniref:RHS repeat domain-containing protein n=1 Tax=Rhizobium sp. 11_C7_N12_5 TaxID=3240770 RepID=UPI000DDF4CB6|nr:hypothetical protein [Ensifer adhaerens]
MTDMNRKLRRPLMLASGSIALAVAIGSYLFLPPATPAEAATPGTITYTYDSLGRIKGDANSAGNSGAYTYDNAGNRTAATLN